MLRGKKRGWVAVVGLAAVLFGLSACDPPPPFVTHSDAESPIWLGHNALTSNAGIFNRHGMPGTINMGADKLTDDFCTYIDMDGHTLDVYDEGGGTYREVATYTYNSIAVLLRDNIVINPNPTGFESWDIYDRTTDKPYVCIDKDELSDYSVGTIFEFRMNYVTDGGTYIWRARHSGTTPHNLTQPRVGYFRLGANNSTGPSIEALNFAVGETVQPNFTPEITLSEELGQFVGFMVSPAWGATYGDDLVGLIPCDMWLNSGDQVIKYCKGKDMLPGRTYYLAILKNCHSTTPPDYCKAGMAITQDRDGNGIAADNTGKFSTGDVNVVLGGDTSGFIMMYTHLETLNP